MNYGNRTRFSQRRDFTRGGTSMEMRSTSIKTAFQQKSSSEPIMIIKGFDEVIRVNIGDTVKIGPGIYRIMEYNPRKEWQKKFEGAKVRASVKCKLIRGEVIPDLKSVSTKDPQTGETLIEICSETFSHFYIPYYKRKEMMEEKKQKIWEQIQRERDRIQ